MTNAALNACAAALAGLACLATAPIAGAQTADREARQVCRTVVGVTPGEKHFAACAQSLTDSLRRFERQRWLAVARRDCLARGLEANTAALAECELAAPRSGVLRVDGPTAPAPSPGGTRDYFLISRETALHRMRLACAALGFDPDQGAFDGCVADLRAALGRASEPSM
ncbi:MAG TPA: hypothetical protein VMU37_06245 [Caulobacteraceae bacterium]|nr:hypothetical protein [Caulobacteraceae bacterium]